MYPHRIRLRGPWECTPVSWSVADHEGSGPLPAPCRMHVPCRWSQAPLAGFTGRVRFSRRFGLPRQIDTHERVWLTMAKGDACAQVLLNGQLVGRIEACEPFEHDVTSLLQERNELVVEVEVVADKEEPLGEVALEIRCTAYLRGLHIWNTVASDKVCLHVTGEVVGFCPEPLELYAILDRRSVGYQPVKVGAPFQMDCDPAIVEPGMHTFRVDLVNGATVWHTVEQAMTW